MKHKFEEYFQLPWSVEFQDTAAFIKSVNMPKQDSIFVDTNIDAHVGAVCYAVACANLMSEAVELLDDAQNIMKWTCELCDGEACGRCGGCDVKGIGSRIAALLAKLEGGADE